MIVRDTENNWHLNPIDVATLVAVGSLAMLTALVRRQLGQNAVWLAGIFMTLVVANLLFARFAPRARWIRIAHDFFPIVVIIVVFSSISPLIDVVRPDRWDGYFSQVDSAYFPGLVAVWREAFGRPDWFTDLIYLAYVSYYPMPFALAVILYGPSYPREQFDEFAFIIALTFFGSYLGYFLFPTYGPRLPLDQEARVLGGGTISEGIRAFIHVAERTKMDAFPSGHTAVAVVCLRYARWCGRVVTGIYVVLATGVVLATVYLYYHYATDVLAGACLAALCLTMGPRIMPWTEATTWQRFGQEIAMRWRALSPKP